MRAKEEPSEIRANFPTLTADDIYVIGKRDQNYESPIDFSVGILDRVLLEPLEWNYEHEVPKLMKLTNSGYSVVLSGKWGGPRPFLCKGPLLANYVFSQLHFHWGPLDVGGSEHTFNGSRLPLELHVMFFNSDYLHSNEAAKQKGGVLNIAFLAELQEEDSDFFKPIIDNLSRINSAGSSVDIDLLPLSYFIEPFNDDYYLYWGHLQSNSALWIVSRQLLPISARQLQQFQLLRNDKDELIETNYRSIKPVGERVVLFVNPILLDNSKLLVSSKKVIKKREIIRKVIIMKEKLLKTQEFQTGEKNEEITDLNRNIKRNKDLLEKTFIKELNQKVGEDYDTYLSRLGNYLSGVIKNVKIKNNSIDEKKIEDDAEKLSNDDEYEVAVINEKPSIEEDSDENINLINLNKPKLITVVQESDKTENQTESKSLVSTDSASSDDSREQGDCDSISNLEQMKSDSKIDEDEIFISLKNEHMDDINGKDESNNLDVNKKNEEIYPIKEKLNKELSLNKLLMKSKRRFWSQAKLNISLQDHKRNWSRKSINGSIPGESTINLENPIRMSKAPVSLTSIPKTRSKQVCQVPKLNTLNKLEEGKNKLLKFAGSLPKSKAVVVPLETSSENKEGEQISLTTKSKKLLPKFIQKKKAHIKSTLVTGIFITNDEQSKTKETTGKHSSDLKEKNSNHRNSFIQPNAIERPSWKY